MSLLTMIQLQPQSRSHAPSHWEHVFFRVVVNVMARDTGCLQRRCCLLACDTISGLAVRLDTSAS